MTIAWNGTEFLLIVKKNSDYDQSLFSSLFSQICRFKRSIGKDLKDTVEIDN